MIPNAYTFVHTFVLQNCSAYFLGILCFRRFFSLSLFPSLFPFLLLVHLSSVTSSLLIYFSRSSCPFLTRFAPSACLSLSLCLLPCFCRHLFWFFSLSLFHLLICKSKNKTKTHSTRDPTLGADLKDSEINRAEQPHNILP